ncbi:hypothetical protein AX14_002075 [Amanita brunnescens Koide BX004]|nr:hypothetical protein AX14_002075 [Amanita brunnescens Koide BX004]
MNAVPVRLIYLLTKLSLGCVLTILSTRHNCRNFFEDVIMATSRWEVWRQAPHLLSTYASRQMVDGIRSTSLLVDAYSWNFREREDVQILNELGAARRIGPRNKE